MIVMEPGGKHVQDKIQLQVPWQLFKQTE